MNKTCFQDKGQGGIPLWGWVLLGGCGCLLSWHWITNEDLGFQLNAARYLVENQDVHRKEPFLWTEPTGTYINLQWLWQLPCYGIWKTGGAGWLMAFNLFLQLSAVGVLILRRLRLGKTTLELEGCQKSDCAGGSGGGAGVCPVLRPFGIIS